MADVKVWNGKCEWGGVRGEVCMGRCALAGASAEV